ncbi:MAG: hypothetical protein ACM30G_08035 [Micromonosporaceae bacterium]
MRARAVAAAVAAVVVGVVVIAFTLVQGGGSAPASGEPPATGAATSSCGGWGCEQQARFAAATALLATKPGHLGLVVRDRTTGAVWQAGEPKHPLWTASTIKLAMAVDLLERDRAGELTLDAKARQQIADMLAFSSNTAATSLWNRYHLSTSLTRYRTTYGMTELAFGPGSSFWGQMKCTTEDLAALMSYILDTLNEADRGYVLGAMRGVQPIQQWGVWAAGAALAPGVKDGWSVERDAGRDHWVVLSVGFAGPGERYVVAVTQDLPPPTTANGVSAGVHAVSDLVATVFGAPVPATVVVPDRD